MPLLFHDFLAVHLYHKGVETFHGFNASPSLREIQHHATQSTRSSSTFTRSVRFATVRVYYDNILIWCTVNPSRLTLEPGFTGKAKGNKTAITLWTPADFERAMPVLRMGYDAC